MRPNDYKSLSIKEFTKAADTYNGDKAGIYKMCRDDFLPIEAELAAEPWQSLLDAGCGTGYMTATLAMKHPDRSCTGLDLTPKMIEEARKNCVPNANFVVGDCEALPFVDDSFDVVICANSFHHYPEPQKFFDSVYRVLRPGGRLILRDYTGNEVLRWLCNHIELPLVRLCGHGDVEIHSLAQVGQMCERAGLKEEKLEAQKGLRLHCVARKPL